MSIQTLSPIDAKHTIPTHLAQLLDAIRADATIDEISRRDMASALRGLGDALGLPLVMIPTDPVALRPLLADFPAARANLSPGRWRNIRSLVQRALAHVGLTIVPGRSEQKLPPVWDALLAGLANDGDRYKLGRFGRYCASVGTEPGAVDDAVLIDYLDDLRARSLAAEPERLHRDVIQAWNRCRAIDPAWPESDLLVPDNRDVYALPWDRFPPSLKADVDAWLDHLACTDPLAEWDFKPLKPASLHTRKRQIHLFVSAIALSGTNPDELHSLAEMVALDRVAAGLRFFWERAGKAPSVHAGQIAGVVKSVARHWVKVSPEHQSRLARMSRQITPEAGGMTKRNRDLLRPLQDPARMRSLLGLPHAVVANVLRNGTPTHSLALQIQTAVAIELLIMAPMRIKNLAALRFGIHLLRDRRGGLTLVLEEDEVKNGMPLEVPLPATTVELVERYVADYLPILSGGRSDYLFPSRTGVIAKNLDGLRTQIATCVLTRCGMKMHPHLFRHLAAMIILEQNPGAYGQAQRVLAHKNINTTISNYCGMEGPAAFRHYDALVTKLRDQPAPISTRLVRKTRKPKPTGDERR